jgi:hypothetical protein
VLRPSFLTVWSFSDVGDSRSGDAVLVGDVESLISVHYSMAEELVSRVPCFGQGRQFGSFQSFRLCAGRPPKQMACRLQSSAPTPDVSTLPRIPLVIDNTRFVGFASQKGGQIQERAERTCQARGAMNLQVHHTAVPQPLGRRFGRKSEHRRRYRAPPGFHYARFSDHPTALHRGRTGMPPPIAGCRKTCRSPQPRLNY